MTDTASSFRVRRVAQGLASPIFVAGLPDGSGRIVVVERAGRIRIVDPATGAISPTDFLNIIPQVRVNGEEGLLSIAFSPDFVADRSFYVHMNNLSGDTEVRRYRTLSSNPAQGDPASGDVILQVDQPAAFTNHKGGWLGFDLSGRLLISLGDGGGGGDPLGSAQDRTSLLGKILRIDPRSDAFPSDPLRDYAIPSANPFAAGGGAPEVLAMGLRNPFRASIDRATGDLYIGDVGQGAVEEIDRLAATTTGLVNYGWNQREGSQPFAGGADSPAFTLPVAEYFHGVGPREGRSVTGGVVHRGPVEALQGEYVFADFISRNIWSVPVARLTAGGVVPSSQFTLRTADFAPDQGAIDAIAAFGEDVAGNLYIVDLTGEVFRLEAGN
ncbi:cadherin domain-containing protein [bacterium]|nr:cadherin domain-containing protein [bacterium]